MSFLVLLLVLLVEKLSSLRQQLQDDRFFLGELRRLESRPGPLRRPWLILALCVLLPCALLALSLLVLQPLAYGLLALPEATCEGCWVRFAMPGAARMNRPRCMWPSATSG